MGLEAYDTGMSMKNQEFSQAAGSTEDAGRPLVIALVVDTAGNAREFGPGDAGIIPAGFIGTFEVIERVRKRYVMLDRA